MPQFFTELGPEQSHGMSQIRNFVDGLRASGQTAIFAALLRAYELAQQAQTQDPSRYYSIVLLTDGENTAGPSLAQFIQRYAALPDTVRQIKTFTILFGEAERGAMEQIAEVTGGRTFDGQKQSLSEVFKTICGYQ
jgi:Ca-activated chloride channel homolog